MMTEAQNQSEKIVESISPFSVFTPPRPRVARFTENFTTDQLWEDWAQKKLADGKSIVAEMKLNGLRAIIEKKGDRVRAKFEKVDITNKVPEIVSIIKRIKEDIILDGDIGVVRSGQRLPRIALMSFLGKVLKFRKNDKIVFTTFDMPYWDKPLSSNAYSERRQLLRVLFDKYDMEKGGFIDSTTMMPVSSKADLQRAYDRYGAVPGSEGLVVKVLDSLYPEGGTDDWSKIKTSCEIKAIVLGVTRNKNGTYGFRAGVFPGRSIFQNITSFRGKPYIDFGKSFNSSFPASEGDIVTFSVEEIILGTANNKPALQWLGARPIDIDKERTTPYFANQVVALAKRGNVLQSEPEITESRYAIIVMSGGDSLTLRRD